MLDLPALAAGTVGICLGFTVQTLRTRVWRQSLIEARVDRDLAHLDAVEAQAEADDLRRTLDAEKRASAQFVGQRDRAARQAKFWAGEVASMAQLILDMGAARDRQVPEPSLPTVIRPVFGHRK